MKSTHLYLHFSCIALQLFLSYDDLVNNIYQPERLFFDTSSVSFSSSLASVIWLWLQSLKAEIDVYKQNKVNRNKNWTKASPYCQQTWISHHISWFHTMSFFAMTAPLTWSYIINSVFSITTVTMWTCECVMWTHTRGCAVYNASRIEQCTYLYEENYTFFLWYNTLVSVVQHIHRISITTE